jgi:hypothetical protein
MQIIEAMVLSPEGHAHLVAFDTEKRQSDNAPLWSVFLSLSVSYPHVSGFEIGEMQPPLRRGGFRSRTTSPHQAVGPSML